VIQGGFAKLCSFIDRWFIDGLLVRGSATVVWTIGFALRFLQVGNVQAYALFFAARRGGPPLPAADHPLKNTETTPFPT